MNISIKNIIKLWICSASCLFAINVSILNPISGVEVRRMDISNALYNQLIECNGILDEKLKNNIAACLKENPVKFDYMHYKDKSGVIQRIEYSGFIGKTISPTLRHTVITNPNKIQFMLHAIGLLFEYCTNWSYGFRIFDQNKYGPGVIMNNNPTFDFIYNKARIIVTYYPTDAKIIESNQTRTDNSGRIWSTTQGTNLFYDLVEAIDEFIDICLSGLNDQLAKYEIINETGHELLEDVVYLLKCVPVITEKMGNNSAKLSELFKPKTDSPWRILLMPATIDWCDQYDYDDIIPRVPRVFCTHDGQCTLSVRENESCEFTIDPNNQIILPATPGFYTHG